MNTPDTPADVPSGRTPASVRQWLRNKHILLFVRAVMHDAPSLQPHCESCGTALQRLDAYYIWQSYENGLTYRLCGFCDVQAAILATDFVHRLKHAIYDPESAVAGWPLHDPAESATKWGHKMGDDISPDDGGRDE